MHLIEGGEFKIQKWHSRIQKNGVRNRTLPLGKYIDYTIYLNVVRL